MDIRKIVRLHKLIKNQRTGSPKELAEKICVSERSVYNYIGYMKIELNAPISYDEEKRSYCYEYDCDFNLDGFNFC
jgi:transcriptional antiterminator